MTPAGPFHQDLSRHTSNQIIVSYINALRRVGERVKGFQKVLPPIRKKNIGYRG